MELGKVLIVIGVGLVLLGLLYQYFGAWFQWVGRLPGDIYLKREGFSFYFPLTTMILISLLIRGLVYVWRWFTLPG
jgi:hypothetical protein